MAMIATVLWWIVLGMLLGWMGSWMFNRTLRTRGAATGASGERVAERRVEVPVERVVERVVPDAAALAARDATIRTLRGRVVHLEAIADVLSGRVASATPPVAQTGAPAPLASVPAEAGPGPSAPAVPTAPARPSAPSGLDLAAAVAAGFAPRGVDDLEIVEGIGPRIAALLRAEGIATWLGLAACGSERLRDVLDLGGPGFRIADPASRPEQAALAAEGRWAELRALQDRLVAGRR